MSVYVVMEPPGQAGGKAFQDAVLIRDGFAFLAFIVPVFWLLWHRLWLEAAVALLVMVLISLAGFYGLHPAAVSLLSLLVSIYVGLEGQAMRIAALRRKDWAEWGTLVAGSRDEVELRYAAEAATHLADEPIQPLAMTITPGPSPRPAPSGSGAALLLNYPGRP
ncbi:DUF2628 domain-containing protein [Oryzicola mucosus]|uniref:DUF2628 domain-containing protein n=1 Tax=Oryzicola mucosus TaxID=2767425 RepID=A0A8J6U6T6_9HYPH|nr:DUF2628 domain-containing protein [Oryzicola mucosus]MBD0413742.1 DUF2628 domain-containing protein [Oryzicola mucosus]